MKPAMSGPGGWTYIEAQMLRQIEAGVTSPEAWSRTIEPYLISYNHFVAWRESHPGQEIPAWINRFRSNHEMDAWVADGMQHYATWSEEADATHTTARRMAAEREQAEATSDNTTG